MEERGVIEIIKDWKGLEKVLGWTGIVAMIVAWVFGIGLSIWVMLTT